MGFQIVDGKGRGYVAAVNDDNRLDVYAVSVSAEHNATEEGISYNAVFNQSPTAGDDCIFYMENESDDDLTVEGIDFGFKNAAAVDAELYIQLNDKGTRNSATDITPANLNAGSGRQATGTFEQGADLDGGAATLTGGTEVQRYMFANIQDRASDHINFEQDIILPKGGTLTIWATDAGATYYITVNFNYGREG